MLKGIIGTSVGNSSIDCLYKYIVVLCIWSGIFTKIMASYVGCSYMDILYELKIVFVYNMLKWGWGVFKL